MTRLYAAIVSVLFVTMCSGVVYSAKVLHYKTDKRVDIIKIDSSSRLTVNERPAVFFPHDLHTDALSEQADTCSVCHSKKDPKAPYHFIDTQSTRYDDIMNGYHDRCIGCHTESIASNRHGGPVICSACHQDKPKVENNGVSARFDKSLHQRHTDTLNKSCKDCHHVYDENLKKTVYEKGKEGSCVYCHTPEGTGDVMPLQKASHQTCVVCHEGRIADGKTSGPKRCEGCHDEAQRKTYKQVQDLDRMAMGQKDRMMLHIPGDEPEQAPLNRLAFVPFDHLRHEMGSESCASCHHKALSSCSSCHTLSGSDASMGVNLETAMHKPHSERSCTGCHETQKKEAQCAGCHGFDRKKEQDPSACRKCHVADTLSDTIEKQAGDLLASALAKPVVSDMNGVPETLMINTLEDKYQGVSFPHRKIINKLVELTGDNRLARYFHQDDKVLCSGCHHNSPPSKTPAACGTCHSAGNIGRENGKPGLLGAYHIQCMECHARMNIRQPESCIQCHKEKK